jgi:organic anion transporter 5A
MLYDTDALRKSLMLTTAFIMIIGVLFDIGVWYYAKNVAIFSQEPKKDEINSRT